MTAAGALDRIPYLRTLPGHERASLASRCAITPVARGSALFVEGDAPAGIFLIISGCIKLVRSSIDGREQVLHEEGPGATLAEVPVFDGGGYVGTAVAVEDAVVCLVPRGPMLDALSRNPDCSLEVIHVLAARVRKLAAVVEDLALRAVTERVAAYLCRESARLGSASFELPATRDDLAGHVGTVREQASRALSELKAAGVIDVKGRSVVILAPHALRLLAGTGQRAEALFPR